MRRKATNISSLEESREVERRHRQRNYLIAMAIRTLCVVSLLFVRGPMIWVVAACAIFTPMIAVVIANQVTRRKNPIERPDAAAVVSHHEPVDSTEWYRPEAEEPDPQQSPESHERASHNSRDDAA